MPSKKVDTTNTATEFPWRCLFAYCLVLLYNGETRKVKRMTVNYFIKCPVCETVTRMRTPAGYIYNTPVRIHCGNCNTLLTGEFISDNEDRRAYYVPGNCKEVLPQNYE